MFYKFKSYTLIVIYIIIYFFIRNSIVRKIILALINIRFLDFDFSIE